ncbi:MAG: hypothetical protein IAB93_05845 [Bacteroidetes bacterium]|uniref:FeoB-associated Cys-rich membrane protein n=1 Tax=Candidatus Merdivivens pullistercoris TaxID=2840873 RepID=A0A9D9I429_9BACT|nr:hypothetical protein [Candidatus Merdivivens pullistercoris]
MDFQEITAWAIVTAAAVIIVVRTIRFIKKARKGKLPSCCSGKHTGCDCCNETSCRNSGTDSAQGKKE